MATSDYGGDEFYDSVVDLLERLDADEFEELTLGEPSEDSGFSGLVRHSHRTLIRAIAPHVLRQIDRLEAGEELSALDQLRLRRHIDMLTEEIGSHA